MELEKDSTLPFLDTLLHRNYKGSLEVTVYRNPHHADQYLKFQSHHPLHVKRELMQYLLDRAQGITVLQDNLLKDKYIVEILKLNGYSNAFISSSPYSPPSQNSEGTGKRWMRKGLVHGPQASCWKFGARVVFKFG